MKESYVLENEKKYVNKSEKKIQTKKKNKKRGETFFIHNNNQFFLPHAHSQYSFVSRKERLKQWHEMCLCFHKHKWRISLKGKRTMHICIIYYVLCPCIRSTTCITIFFSSVNCVSGKEKENQSCSREFTRRVQAPKKPLLWTQTSCTVKCFYFFTYNNITTHTYSHYIFGPLFLFLAYISTLWTRMVKGERQKIGKKGRKKSFLGKFMENAHFHRRAPLTYLLLQGEGAPPPT